MDRDLLQVVQHLTPHDQFHHHAASSASFFFNPSCGGGGCGFAAASLVVAPNDDDYSGWAAGDLMLHGGGVGSTVGTAADDDHHLQLWQSAVGSFWDDNPPAPPPCQSTLDGDHGDYGTTGKQGSVPELASSEQKKKEKGNVVGATQRKGRDRAKTVVLERKRRVRMQEKLHELRALVPNITKMDKASIIGDAVVYVRNLQSRARKLKEEVAALEARRRPESPAAGPPQHDGDDRRATEANDKRRDDHDDRDPAGRRSGSSHVVASVGAARVGEGRFLVTVECERRDGVAARLCAAVESLHACFRVQSSSLGRAAPDRLVSTAMLKATCPAEAATIGEGTVKLLVLAALGEQGFRIDATAGIS